MQGDIDALMRWFQVCLWIASIGATSVPIVYAFSPWYRSRLGRIIMLQGVAFALVLDLTLLFQYWKPGNLLVILWVYASVFTLIALATSLLAIKIVYLNYRHQRGFNHVHQSTAFPE